LHISQEAKEGKKASEASEIKLYAQYPPVEKMDASLSTLTACEYVKILHQSFPSGGGVYSL